MADANKTPYNSQPTSEELQVRERGPGRVPEPPVGEQPAGGAKWAVDHAHSKIGLINLVARTYRWTHDEALRHSRSNARACLRDLVVRNALMARFVPVQQLSWHLQPPDPTDPQQIEATAKLTKIVEMTPRWSDFLFSLQWGEWFGWQGLAQLFEWVPVHDEMWMVTRDFRPINGDSLIPRWSGDWGQLVNGTWQGDKEPTDRGFAHFFTPEEREAIIIHTAPPEDSDFEEPDLAGQIRGSGLRGHVYWAWWLKSNFEALLADFGERFANGVWKAYFETGNEQGRAYMESAVAAYKNNRVLLIPRDQEGKSAFGLEIEEVGTGSPQFLLELRDELNKLIHEYITFGSLNEIDLAVGGDGAGLVADRISRGVKYSATRLAETLTEQWIKILARYNTPGVPPPKFVFETEKANAGEIMGYAQALHALGGPIDLDHLYEVAGLPMPAPDATVASNLQPLSPVMDRGTPTGVPVAEGQQPQPEQPTPTVTPSQTPTQSAPPNLLEN